MNELDLYVVYLTDEQVAEYDKLFKATEIDETKDIIINAGITFTADTTPYQIYLKGIIVSEDGLSIEKTCFYITTLDNDVKEITPYVEGLADKVVRDVLIDIFKGITDNERIQS